jgi:hypothetical protein
MPQSVMLCVAWNDAVQSTFVHFTSSTDARLCTSRYVPALRSTRAPCGASWAPVASAEFSSHADLCLCEVPLYMNNEADTEGMTPLNTPDYTANVWTTFRIATRWKIGGGVEAVGARFANSTDTNQVPRYARVDALVEYAKASLRASAQRSEPVRHPLLRRRHAGHVARARRALCSSRSSTGTEAAPMLRHALPCWRPATLRRRVAAPSGFRPVSLHGRCRR